jgi:hypothetical protein
MTTSTDAYLFFGFSLPEDSHPPGTEEGDDGWIHFLAQAVGGDFESWDEDGHVKRTLGVVVDWHCSDRCSIPFIAVEEGCYTACRGDETEINPEAMVIQPEWVQRLKKVAHLLGLDKQEAPDCYWCKGEGTPEEDGTPCRICKGTGKDPHWEAIDTEPRWFLVSWWG